MNDDTPDPTDESPEDADDGIAIRENLLKAALVVLGLVAVAATFQLYTSLGAVIREWIAPEYRPLFRAGLNLVVLLAAGIGISLTLRRLAGDAPSE